MKKKLLKLKELFSREGIKRYFLNLISLESSPSRLALSIAIGIFIGVAIPMGFQTLAAIPLAMLFDCNVVITIAATYISNPLTVVPMYFMAFKIGESITGIVISWEKLNYFFSSPSFDEILNIGGNGLIVFFAGSFLQAIILALITYFASLKFISIARKKSSLESPADKI